MIKFNEFMKDKIIFSYEISLACNLRCSYCYELKFLDNKKTHNSEIANLVIEKLTEFKKENPNIELELDLLGGDPLMAPNLIEFVTELSKIDIVIWIVTNLTFSKERVEEVGKLLELPNVGISATWHDNINDDVFKENVLVLKKYAKKRTIQVKDHWMEYNFYISFVLFNENKDMLKRANWALDNGIMYGVTHFYDKQKRFQTYDSWNKSTKFVFDNSVNAKYDLILGDKKLTPQEYQELELYQIAEKNNVVCEPLNFNISYFGDVNLSCQMKNKKTHLYNIRDGLKRFRLFCPGGDCYCSEFGYKEIHGEKK